MNTSDPEKVLDLLIEYFETGNAATDAAAKAIFTEDGEYDDHWREVLDEFRQGIDWTGVRGPEAEFLALSLKSLRERLSDKK